MPMPSLQDAISLYGPTPMAAGVLNQLVQQGGQQFDTEQAQRQATLQDSLMKNQITQQAMPDLIAHQGALNAQLLGQAHETENRAEQTRNMLNEYYANGGVTGAASRTAGGFGGVQRDSVIQNLGYAAATGAYDSNPDAFAERLKNPVTGLVVSEASGILTLAWTNATGPDINGIFLKLKFLIHNRFCLVLSSFSIPILCVWHIFVLQYPIWKQFLSHLNQKELDYAK